MNNRNQTVGGKTAEKDEAQVASIIAEMAIRENEELQLLTQSYSVSDTDIDGSEREVEAEEEEEGEEEDEL